MSADRPRRTFRLGPGVFVTAAFIGPGTVMTASGAGAQFGYALLWAVLFSVVATIVLQEMAARLGVVTGDGLAHAIRTSVPHTFVRWLMIALVLGGILFGNAAYQTGNLLGAATGLEILLVPVSAVEDAATSANGPSVAAWLSIAVAAMALTLIWTGRFSLIQTVLTALVALMGILFLIAAIAIRPDPLKLLAGLNPVSTDWRVSGEATGSGNSIWFVVGLIGTTVVPYNLFLHASAAASRWGDADEVSRSARASMIDTVVSVAVGGLITAALLVTAAVAFGNGGSLETVRDIALQLKPALGAWAEVLFASGLFAAGLTSAITAPLAAGYAAAGCFGWPGNLSDWRLKTVATVVVLSGVGSAVCFGSSPRDAIVVAQVANGLLLPLIAIFLLVMVNRSNVMGTMRNGWFSNLAGTIVVALTLLLSARMLRPVLSRLTDWLQGQ